MSEIDFSKLKAHRKDYNARGRYAAGGKVAHDDEAEDRDLVKKMIGKARIKLSSGGDAYGVQTNTRIDKPARLAKGGKVPHTKVNVIIAGGRPPMGAPQGAPPPMGARPPMAPHQMPPRPPMTPMQGGIPPQGAPSIPPPGMKRGGRLPPEKLGGEHTKVGEQERGHDNDRRKVNVSRAKYAKEIGLQEEMHDKQHHRGEFKKPAKMNCGGRAKAK